MILILLVSVITGSDSLVLNNWHWSQDDGPMQFFSRKNYPAVPAQEISQTLECECPPHKECVLEFKLNEDAPEFLNLRGVLKDEDMHRYMRDIKEIQEKEHEKLRKTRRSANEVMQGECCCPPRTVMAPAFITDKAFDSVMKNIANNYKTE